MDSFQGKHNIPKLPQEKLPEQAEYKGKKKSKQVTKGLPPKMASSLRGFNVCAPSGLHRTKFTWHEKRCKSYQFILQSQQNY